MYLKPQRFLDVERESIKEGLKVTWQSDKTEAVVHVQICEEGKVYAVTGKDAVGTEIRYNIPIKDSTVDTILYLVNGLLEGEVRASSKK